MCLDVFFQCCFQPAVPFWVPYQRYQRAGLDRWCSSGIGDSLWTLSLRFSCCVVHPCKTWRSWRSWECIPLFSYGFANAGWLCFGFSRRFGLAFFFSGASMEKSWPIEAEVRSVWSQSGIGKKTSRFCRSGKNWEEVFNIFQHWILWAGLC